MAPDPLVPFAEAAFEQRLRFDLATASGGLGALEEDASAVVVAFHSDS